MILHDARTYRSSGELLQIFQGLNLPAYREIVTPRSQPRSPHHRSYHQPRWLGIYPVANKGIPTRVPGNDIVGSDMPSRPTLPRYALLTPLSAFKEVGTFPVKVSIRRHYLLHFTVSLLPHSADLNAQRQVSASFYRLLIPAVHAGSRHMHTRPFMTASRVGLKHQLPSLVGRMG